MNNFEQKKRKQKTFACKIRQFFFGQRGQGLLEITQLTTQGVCIGGHIYQKLGDPKIIHGLSNVLSN